MSIAKLSDAVVLWLVPRTTASACLAPEGCGACSYTVSNVCYNGQIRTLKYTVKATDCTGQCRLSKKMLCYIGPGGRIC